MCAVQRLPEHLADVVARVPDSALPQCLRLLAITAVDATDLGGESVVRDALTQWRVFGRVSPATRTAVDALLAATEQEGFDHQRRAAVEDWRIAYHRVRTLECLRICLDPRRAPRAALADAAYEAAGALRGSAAVAAILTDFVVGALPIR